MKKYYIYAHSIPASKEIFYIGKGCGNRKDFRSNRSEFWKRTVSKYGLEVSLLAENLSEKAAYKKERQLITAYKKIGLCRVNMSLGGDGVKVKKRWWGDKISKAMKGKNKGRGLESHSYKDIVSKEQLLKWYVEENKNIIEISKLCGLSTTTLTTRLRSFGIEVRQAGRIKIKIKCLKDGRVFNSIADAARYYGVFRENIKKVLLGQYKHTGKLTFKKI